MKKLYMGDAEFVHELEWWIDCAYDQGKPVIVELVKRDRPGGEMWCNYHAEYVERGCSEGCGNYNPCNGLRGRCRDYGWSFIGTGKFFRITEKGQVRRHQK